MAFVKTEVQGAVEIITIDRPKALNALNPEVLADLKAAFEAVDQETIRCIVLTGEGDKSFVAGADIGSMSTMTKAEGEAFGKLGNDVFLMIESFPIPVIAAVNGFALGGGNELAMSCDIRICSDNAVFGQPEVGLGITPGFGGTQRLARLVGMGMAKQLVYSALNIKADEAYRIGLVNAVYPQAELMENVLKLAGKRVDNMLLKEPAAMKCAFGENPKGCYGQGMKKSPMTRMAVAALLRELLFKTQRYRDDKLAGKNPPFDMKLEAMLPVINGEIPLKCHAHRADDILTAVRIAKEFGVKATLDHCTDGELISDELAKEGLPVFVGPTLGSKSKAELRHKSFTTPGALYRAGLTVSIITDAPVIPLENLTMCAGLAANAGLPMDEAWRAITINPARSLGIDSRVGSLEPGKDADFVLWTADPLTTIGGQAYMTVIDGKVVYRAE